MLIRVGAVGLWAYFGWYLGAIVADTAGISPDLGIAGALLIGAGATIDWRSRRTELATQLPLPE